MSKSKFDFVSFTIVAACILALIFLIYKTINMYNQNKAKQANATEQRTIDDGEADLYDNDGGTYKFDDEEEVVDDGDGSRTADNSGSTTGTSQDGNSSANNSSDNNSSTVGSSTEDEASDNSNNNTSSDGDSKSSALSDNTNTTNYSHSKGSGRYMVLAGSFRQESNANSHAAKLRRMGYDGAEVSIFNRGAYASVLVDRFSDKSDARSLARELENKGIEALVITKR